MTTYEYDQDGRMVRAVTTREPEWDDQERAWMLGLAQYEATAICPSCGGLASECQDPANEGRFHVGPPVRCHRTTAIEHAAEAYKDADANRALLFAAQLRD